MTAVSLKASQANEQNNQSIIEAESEIELEVIEQTAKKYLQYFHSSDVLDKGIILIPKALKKAYKEIGITLTEYAVMELLLTRWYQDKAQPEVSMQILAEELGKSRLQIWRHIKKLQQKGVLIVSHVYDKDGGQRNNRYNIYPFIERLEAYANQRQYTVGEKFVEDEVAPQAVALQIEIESAPISIQPEVLAEPAPAPATVLVNTQPAVTVSYADEDTFQLPPPALGPKGAHASRLPSQDDKDMFQLPPPALGPKTPGKAMSSVAETEYKEETTGLLEKKSKKTESTTKKKTEHTTKSRKKNKQQDDSLTPRAIAEGVNRLVNIYVDADASEQQQRIREYAEMVNPAARPIAMAADTENETETETDGAEPGIEDERAQFEEDQQGTLLPSRVVEYMHECFTAFSDTALDDALAYKIIIRIYKKALEVKLISKDYLDEHIETNFLNTMVRATKYTIYQLQAAETAQDQVTELDVRVNFVELLDTFVEEDRQIAAYDWGQLLLDSHEKQFNYEHWGIPVVQQPTITARQMLEKPGALITREKSSARAPYGIELINMLRYYGVQLERRIESNLLSKMPNIEKLKEMQGILRMEQFRDEQEQLKHVTPWHITGSTLELYCNLYLDAAAPQEEQYPSEDSQQQPTDQSMQTE